MNRKITALILVFLLCLSIPFFAFAEENGGDNATIEKNISENITEGDASDEISDGTADDDLVDISEGVTEEESQESVDQNSVLEPKKAGIMSVPMVTAGAAVNNQNNEQQTVPDSFVVSMGADFAKSTVYVDGKSYVCDDAGNVTLPDGNAKILQVYTFNKTEGDAHGIYPTSMKVYSLTYAEGHYTVTYMPEFDNIMQFLGISIKFTAPSGVRILTGIPTDKRDLLVGGGLSGYTLDEYGTLLMFASDVSDTNPFVMGAANLKSGSAYRKADGYNKVFGVSNGLTQYTNPLVFSSKEVYDKELLLRSYMKLTNASGETVVIYGGIINRTIKYVAEKNISKYPVGSTEYNYLRAIIDGNDPVSGQLIGHMGLKGLCPGNTAESFAIACQNGMWAIECDLRSSKDKVLICSHEEDVNTNTNFPDAWGNPVAFHNLYYSDIANLVIDHDKNMNLIAQYPNLHVGTFEQYLDICNSYGRVALIDIKWIDSSLGTNSILHKMVDMVNAKGMLSRISG